MRKFVFQFEALLKLRGNRRDLCRQLLAQMLADDRKLVRQRKAIKQSRRRQLGELRNFGQGGEVDIDRSASRRYYAGQLLGEIRLVERNLKVVGQQMELCREALKKADREVKILEKLEEKQRAEFLYQQQRRAAKEMEEAWLATRISEYSK